MPFQFCQYLAVLNTLFPHIWVLFPINFSIWPLVVFVWNLFANYKAYSRQLYIVQVDVLDILPPSLMILKIILQYQLFRYYSISFECVWFLRHFELKLSYVAVLGSLKGLLGIMLLLDLVLMSMSFGGWNIHRKGTEVRMF